MGLVQLLLRCAVCDVRARLEVFKQLDVLGPTQVGLILEHAFFRGIASGALSLPP